MALLINKGNTDDIRGSLKHCEDKLTIKQLLEEIELEAKGQKRKTVIDMLTAAIKRKNKLNLSSGKINNH